MINYRLSRRKHLILSENYDCYLIDDEYYLNKFKDGFLNKSELIISPTSRRKQKEKKNFRNLLKTIHEMKLFNGG